MPRSYSKSFRTVDINPGATGFWSATPYSDDKAIDAIPRPKIAQVNWAKSLTFTPRNQGKWNACTSFALTAMVEARRTLRGSPVPRLMGGFLHYCALGERDPDIGRNAPEIAGAAAAQGIKPGPGDGLPSVPVDCALNPALAIKIIGSAYTEPSVSAANNLAKNGPLLVEVLVPVGFEELGRHELWDIATDGDRILHSMLMIGYDWDAQTMTVLGSNGSSWGNRGFATLDMRQAQFHSRYPFEVLV